MASLYKNCRRRRERKKEKTTGRQTEIEEIVI
jgi:hypothetical protein